MKGCLGLIIKIIIIVLVFFGLVHLGVIDFIKNEIAKRTTVSQEQLIEKTKDIVDLSQIDDEYSVTTDFKILKNRMIIANHNATEQKMIMIEPNKEDILTKEDITSDKVQEKIENALQKYKNKPIKFEKIEVTKQGELFGIGQKVPYVRFNVEIANIPIKDMEGIVGVAELKNGEKLIVISANEKGKYSQIITDAFYKKVK